MEEKKKIILIMRGSDDLFTKGTITWSGSHMEKIKSLFPEVMSLDQEQLEAGLGMFAKTCDKKLPLSKLKIISFKHDQNQICVKFQCEEKLEFTSGDFSFEVRRFLRKTGSLPVDGSLPFGLFLQSNQVSSIMNRLREGRNGSQSILQEKIKHNDWLGIYKMYSPIIAIPHNRPETWDDPGILDNIAYACAKLAETSSVPREFLHDDRKRVSFLNQQAQYRQEAETLRKRCIELVPNNAAYWANLGFLHYQNVMELSARGGRRDGDLLQEAEQAIKYYDNALSLDSFRIKEWYRKGYLLTEKLPNQILFGKKQSIGQNCFEEARQKRQEGIRALVKAVELFESIAEEKKKHFRREYIKALYHLGKTYYDEICKIWDEGIFALDLRSNVTTKDKVGHIPQDLTNANLAWKYFLRCWMEDRKNLFPDADLEKKPDLALTETGVEESVDKLYWLGRVAFVLYWISSGYGQVDTPEAADWRDSAETYLTAALKCPWSDEKARKPKDFIAELLARLYITKAEYDRAIECIKTNCSKHLPYIAQTIALAYQLSGRTDDARRILREAARDRGNKEPWTTHFLMGCAYMHEGNFEMAKHSFEVADQECRKRGKQTLDTVLIGLAFTSYKLNDTVKAVSYMKQAFELNPYRVSVQRHLRSWEEKRVVHSQ